MLRLQRCIGKRLLTLRSSWPGTQDDPRHRTTCGEFANKQWQQSEMTVLTWILTCTKYFGCIGKELHGGFKKAPERKWGVSLFLKDHKFDQAKKQKKPFLAKRTVNEERCEGDWQTSEQLESEGCKRMVTLRQISLGPQGGLWIWAIFRNGNISWKSPDFLLLLKKKNRKADHLAGYSSWAGTVTWLPPSEEACAPQFIPMSTSHTRFNLLMDIYVPTQQFP